MKFSFIDVIQIARDNGLCEFCTEEGEFNAGYSTGRYRRRKGRYLYTVAAL